MEMQMLISASTERQVSAYAIRRGGGSRGCRSNNKKGSCLKDKDALEIKK